MLRDLMPSWVGWLGPAIVLALAIVFLLLIPGVSLWLVRRRLVPGLHWTKQADLATEARAALVVGVVMGPMMSLAWTAWFNGPFSVIPDWAVTALAALLAVLVVTAISWWFTSGPLRQPLPGLGRYYWLVARKSWPAVWLILLIVFAPPRLTSWWMLPWTALVVASLHGLRYLAELYMATGVAQPAPPRVTAAVARAAGQMGADAPRIVVFESSAANAFALPVRNLILMTTRLIDELDDAELEAVALHEIAHLGEHRSVTRRRQIGTLALVPFFAIKPLLAAGIWVLVAVLAATLAFRLLLSRMEADEETRADHTAVELSHESSALGTALLKMHQAALIPAFVKRDPHGPLHERLTRAGVTPDFAPIEKAPKHRSLTAALTLSLVLVVAVAAVPWYLIDIWDSGNGSHAAIAFGWRTNDVLRWTGYNAAERGDFERSIPYLEESATRGDYGALVDLPWVYSALGRCDEARAALSDLQASPDAAVSDLQLAAAWVAYCERG